MSEDEKLDPVFKALRDEVPIPPRESQMRATFIAEVRHLQKVSTVSGKPAVRPNLWRLFSSKKDTQKGNQTMKRSNRTWGIPVLVAVVSLLIVGVVFAQDIINFFTRLQSNSSQTVIYYDPTTPQANPVTLTQQQAVAQADFAVSVPAYIPSAYQFDGAIYNPQAHSLFFTYSCGQGMVRSFGLEQTAMSEPANHFKAGEVGASAVIEDVQIRDVQGQYVRGAWRVANVPDLSTWEAAGLNTSIPATQIWDNNSEFQHLGWYKAGVLYRLMTTAGALSDDDTSGACKLTKADFVAIAKSLTPVK